MSAEFSGFGRDFFAFFRELRANNDRAWFEANKQRFRENVQVPMSAFIEAMAPRLAKITKNFTADPRVNGGSMFRVYRDVRFSKDKRPYKEHAACHFRHRFGRDAHAPGFYMHFAPDEIFFGGGLWLPPFEALAKIRGAIVARPTAWKKMLTGRNFVAHFEGVAGDALSRPPRGFDPAHPLIEDIKRKSFFAMREGNVKLAQSPNLIEEVTETFHAASPLMRFLCNALDVPY
ncbi:MAG: DUF2461 domain-containing protein [Alphaproteobacteria bacterium]|nr:DUF2461 domain-containing protein [Alphaproteobacteria bacterium]MDE2013910.1 DUF2461 domain-containing protein [Alphaproteobacteria bacterium]MDE2073081.1 DUF2461 domain-containing protein [Alphaproteobacteria bacterium]